MAAGGGEASEVLRRVLRRTMQSEFPTLPR